MSTPYERILRHEPHEPGGKICPPCSHGLINTPCGSDYCHCACNAPAHIFIPDTTAPTEETMLDATFYFPTTDDEGWVRPAGRQPERLNRYPDVEGEFVEAQIGNAVTPGILLLTGAGIGVGIGFVTAYPSIPLAARITVAVILTFVILLCLAGTVERTQDAGS